MTEHDSAAAGVLRGHTFFDGLSAPWRGWRLIARERSLWPHVVVPVLVNVALTLLTFLALVALAIWFASYAHPWFHDGRWSVWGVGYVLEILFVVLLLIAAAVGAMVAWIAIAGALCGTFYARLARAVEVHLGTPREELQDVPIFGDIADSIAEVGSLVRGNLPWVVLGILPCVGAPLAILGSAYTNGFLFGSQFIGIPLAIRGQRRAARIEYCRQRRPLTLGMGSSVFLCQLVPLIGAFLLTGAVAGAVMLHRRESMSQQREKHNG